MTASERNRQLQRAFYGLYRWYVDRSQTQRNWSADRSFDWRLLRRNHSPELMRIVEGFYAVEQYVPDYTSELTRLARGNYGRAHFQLRWGAEEEKHADLWRNTLLFSRARTPEQIEEYTDDLRKSAWVPPFESPIEMILYTVFQERATQMNYMNLRAVAEGKSDKPQFAQDTDQVLAEVCRMIAVDEAAHFDFFLAGAQLYLYYFPEETLEALVKVFRHFAMPASDIIPDYDGFVKVLYDGGIFTREVYAREVAPMALEKLGVTSIRAIEQGIRRSRLVPDTGGTLRETAIFETEVQAGYNKTIVESAVMNLFGRIQRYEAEVGLDEVAPLFGKKGVVE